jgi:hypothetical protein
MAYASRWYSALQLAIAVSLGAVAMGCATATKVYVKSSAQTNDGNTLYMVVRNVDGKPVANEPYQEAARKLFTDPPDPSILSSQPVFPGNTVTVTVENGDAKDIVIYFFFTAPANNNWRVPLRKPLPAEVFIDLGQNQVDRVQVRKRLRCRRPRPRSPTPSGSISARCSRRCAAGRPRMRGCRRGCRARGPTRPGFAWRCSLTRPRGEEPS